jgi:transcription elongation factor Elf1
MDFIDRKYINQIAHRLHRFKQKTRDEYNFRCPICGDSEKSKSKARAHLISKKDKTFFYCFNCSSSLTLYSFLKKISENDAKEYYFEKFKEKFASAEIHPGLNEVVEPPTVYPFSFTPKFTKTPKNILQREAVKLETLTADHVAVQYIINRKIPIKHAKRLYYIDDFSVLDKKRKLVKEPRLIVPYYDIDGTLVGFTGRALGSSGLRYINVSLSDEQSFYGLDIVDLDKPVYVVEGAFDSMFLDNAIAVNNANLSRISNVIDRNKCILIPDKEPRNKVIVDNIYKFIEMGFTVSLLPHSLVGKDINEYIINGVEGDMIMGIINNNKHSGIIARIKLTEWKRI